MEVTVYLRQNEESGTWMYGLPGANRKIGTVELNGVMHQYTAGQRVKYSDVDEMIATYDYHYAILDDVDPELSKKQVNKLGFTDEAILNTSTGELTPLS